MSSEVPYYVVGLDPVSKPPFGPVPIRVHPRESVVKFEFYSRPPAAPIM